MSKEENKTIGILTINFLEIEIEKAKEQIKEINQQNKELKVELEHQINRKNSWAEEYGDELIRRKEAESRIKELEKNQIISNLNQGDLEAQISRILLDYNAYITDRIVEEIEQLREQGKHAKFCDFLNNLRGDFEQALNPKEG